METEASPSRFARIIPGIVASVAVLFGLLTIFAGGRVLFGTDPGYIVYKPLLVFNTAMGVAYVAAGIVAWCSLKKGMYAAATIFVLNAMVLVAVYYLYAKGSAVAMDSVRAITLRTVVWLGLFITLAWLARTKHRVDSRRGA